MPAGGGGHPGRHRRPAARSLARRGHPGALGQRLGVPASTITARPRAVVCLRLRHQPGAAESHRQALSDLELYHHFYGHCEPFVQRFESSTTRRRRGRILVASSPRSRGHRKAVSDVSWLPPPGQPEAVYRDFYVQRGEVPEQPIGEMKNGLQADRLSACGFCANAFRLLVHTWPTPSWCCSGRRRRRCRRWPRRR